MTPAGKPARRKPAGRKAAGGSRPKAASKASAAKTPRARTQRAGGAAKTSAAAARTGSEMAAPARSLRIGSLRPAVGAMRDRKRRGLGTASGLGGTSGRGHKGQRARKSGNAPRWFEGGQMPIQRRVPKRGFKHVGRVERQVVNVESLARFAKGEAVNRETLKAKRLIGRSDLPVKILGTGELTQALQVSVDAVSASARTKIEAAGGTVVLPAPKTPRPRGVRKAARV